VEDSSSRPILEVFSMKMRLLLALVAGLILTSLTARQAAAGSPFWWPYWGGSIYAADTRGLPPYFSLFPPVYYSYPVPRTYGYSPFAYPLGSPTPEVTITDSNAQIMINPYVPKSQPSAAGPAEKTVGGPLTIVNPYVELRVDLARDAD
jgi:hypothetical protein